MRATVMCVTTLIFCMAAFGCGGPPGAQPGVEVVKENVPELPAIQGPPDVALRRAALEGQMPIVQSALAKGADVNASNADGVTALMLAGAKGYRDLVDMLLSKGARADAATKEDKVTALMMAANWGHTPVVDLLLDKGANLSTEDGGKRTVLDWAGMDESVKPEDSKALQRHLKEKGAKESKQQGALGLFLSVGSMPKLGALLERAALEK